MLDSKKKKAEKNRKEKNAKKREEDGLSCLSCGSSDGGRADDDVGDIQGRSGQCDVVNAGPDRACWTRRL